MERQRFVLIVILILFFLFSPDTSQPSPSQRIQFKNRILREQRALAVLKNSSYRQFPIRHFEEDNATDIGDWDGISWSQLAEVQKRARAQYLELLIGSGTVNEDDIFKGSERAYEIAAETSLPFYKNVSGTIHGDFVRQAGSGALSAQMGQDSNGSIHEYWRNVTEDEGAISLQTFEEDKSRWADHEVREISANVAIQTASSPGNGWKMKLFGLHYPKTGLIILTTTSEKFSGIFTLPHFALTSGDFEDSKQLLYQSLTDTVSQRENSSTDDPVNPLASTTETESMTLFPTPSCEYIVYLQQQPVQFPKLKMNTEQTFSLVRQVERELRFPEGPQFRQFHRWSSVLPYSPQIVDSS